MKIAFVTLITLVIHAQHIRAQETGAGPKTNAYLIVFEDRAGRPLANATIFTPEFRKENRKVYDAKCLIKLLKNEGKEEEDVWFKRLIPKGGDRKVMVETRTNAELHCGLGDMSAHVRIEFCPGVADANISVSLNLDKDVPVGTWGYATFSGGEDGGKVKVSRIQTEQMGADQPATKPADKPATKDQPTTPMSEDVPR